jgi:hypothetical protein
VGDRYMYGAADPRSWPWMLEVWPAAGGVRGILGAAGVEIAPEQAITTPVIRELPGLQSWVQPAVDWSDPRELDRIGVVV